MDNLTTGMAILVHSLIATISQPNSVILLANHTYNAVKLAVQRCVALAESRHGVTIDIVTVDIPFPIISGDYNDIILSSYEKTMKNISSEKVVLYAFIDHITSVPGMRMPIGDIVSLLRTLGVREVIYLFIYLDKMNVCCGKLHKSLYRWL